MATDAGPLDFRNDVPGAADFDLMPSRGHLADAGGVAVWVVGFADLIRMKDASGREQDLLGIHKLEALRATRPREEVKPARRHDRSSR